MVELQLYRRGIRSRWILDAFLETPRHLFVPKELQSRAYMDAPLPIGAGQTISQPYMVAAMIRAGRLKDGDRVLDVGTGSGYQAAVLATMGLQVFSIERLPGLAEKARRVLKSLGLDNVKIRVGDGTLGWPEEGPFAAILAAAASPRPPAPLLTQLAEGGRLVIPLVEGRAQTLFAIEKRGGEMRYHRLEACAFVPLIGEYAWPAGDCSSGGL